MSEPRVVVGGGGTSDSNETSLSFTIASNVIGFILRVTPYGASNSPKYYAFSIDGNTLNMPTTINYITSVSMSSSSNVKNITVNFTDGSISTLHWSPVYELSSSTGGGSVGGSG